MANTKAYNEALSERERLAIIKKAKGGTWYDGWCPYHIRIPFDPNCTSPRMIQMPWGFRCPSCGADLGFNCERIENEPFIIRDYGWLDEDGDITKEKFDLLLTRTKSRK